MKTTHEIYILSLQQILAANGDPEARLQEAKHLIDNWTAYVATY